MPTIVIPPLMRSLTDGEARVQVAGRTVGEAIAALDVQFPGVKARLCEGSSLAPELAVVVDGRLSRLGLLHLVGPENEVRFIAAIEGG